MKYKSNKIVTAVLAILLVVVIAGAAALVGVLSDGFKDWTKFQPDEQTEQMDETADNGSAIIGESVGNGVKLMSAKIPVAEYAANGVSAQAETAYTLTASVYPEKYASAGVDWSVAFANTDSENTWGDNKTVTDYVTVTPTSDGALTANVECVAAFGEQIIVTCTSRNNTSVSATCTVDYQQKFNPVLKIGGEIVEDGSIIPVTVDLSTEFGNNIFFEFLTHSDIYTIPFDEDEQIDFSTSSVDVKFPANLNGEVMPSWNGGVISFPGTTELSNKLTHDLRTSSSDSPVGHIEELIEINQSESGILKDAVLGEASLSAYPGLANMFFSSLRYQDDSDFCYGWNITISVGEYECTVLLVVDSVVDNSTSATQVTVSEDSIIF